MPVTSEIEFVYFDLGNVLVAFDPDLACANLSKRCRVTFQQAHEAVYTSGLQNRFEHGEVTGQQYASFVRQQFAQAEDRLPTQVVLDAVSEMFSPIESMRNTLERVRANRFRVGVLSNTCSAHWQWILRQAYPVMAGEFEVTILSYEVGSMKPDAAIYRAAEVAAKVPVNKILFLDDREENVQAARDRGWNAEQCIGGEQAEAALAKHNVI